MPLTRLPLRIGRWLILTSVMTAVMIGVAGRSDRVMLNVYLGMCAAVLLVAALVVDPDLVKERLRGGASGEDPARLLFIRLLFLATFAIALLDIGRFHWSDSVPRAASVVALAVTGASFAWIVWAVSVNRFFLPVVRIQSERGHQVVASGPYARVRHPGYAGMVLMAPGSALALGSWWALAPALGLSLLFLRRTAHEDRFLREQLAGYDAYAARVRYRLVPGVW